MASTPHVWRFFLAGGIDQVELKTPADLAALDTLDPKLWVALSCPTQGLEFDSRTLQLLDTDKDGRIRVPEILEAVRWTLKRLKDSSTLLRGETALPLGVIESGSEAGRRVLASARRILENLGKADAGAITPGDTADTARIFMQTRLNGDGVVPPDSASDAETRKVLDEIVLTMGGEADRSGKLGVSRAKSDAFFAECRAFDAWWTPPRISGEAFDSLQSIRAKADDFFLRCRLASFSPDAALDPSVAALSAVAGKQLHAGSEELRGLPLAKVVPGGRLPLAGGVNPAWERDLSGFRSLVAEGRTELSQEEWEKLKAAFVPHEAWLAGKKGGAVEKLGAERVKQLVSGKQQKAVEALIEEDLAVRGEFEDIEAVDRLVRYHRDLHRLLNNFVSFAEFYGRKSPAVFQAGSLYIDGRRCDLCLRVADMGRHSALASGSRTFLIYCECSRKDSPEKMLVAAALTGGDSDHIFVGRNGVFYDRQGRDWDATIVKVIEHPISIRQAVWSPYKRFVRFVGEQIEKFASAKDKAVQDKLQSDVQAGVKPEEKAPPFDVAKFAGIFAAIGLAIGGIAAGLGKLVEAFASLLWWQKPLALAGVFAAVSGPSAIIAWLKLRQRNLGPLLDANGWAINGRVKVNIPFGAALTSMAELPSDAIRSLKDPYAPENKGLVLGGSALLILLVLAGAVLWLWRTGRLEGLLGCMR